MAANTPLAAGAGMKFLERVVLDTPYLFLKKIPYAWIPVVALWTWPPVISGLFLGIILLGLAAMVLQQRFWEAKVLRESMSEEPAYRAHPHMPWWMRLRNLALVLAGSAVIGFLLGGRLSLSGMQWFLLVAGFMFLYKDALLFGASAVYLVTRRGIGVRWVPGHVDYRLFFPYNEINSITRVRAGDKLPEKLDVLSPVRGQKEGVLLMAKRMDGFSSQIGHVLLTPDDPDEFLQQVPATLISGHSFVR